MDEDLKIIEALLADFDRPLDDEDKRTIIHCSLKLLFGFLKDIRRIADAQERIAAATERFNPVTVKSN